MNCLMSKKALCGILVAATVVAGCGGTRMIREPGPIEPGEPLATAGDERLGAALDWVVVRNGPGAWVTNADWDEYRLRIANHSADAVRILVSLSTTRSERRSRGLAAGKS